MACGTLNSTLVRRNCTGTFVTVQAFQQGIGTGACGPAIAPEFLYDARRDYRLQFLIRVAPTCQLE